MPTLLRWRGFRFFFYSADGSEPPHIHVVKDGKEVKIWLNELKVAVNLGFSSKEVNQILAVTDEHRLEFLEKWHDHFGN
ncbi:MAG: DUF4160 domain-containing protein [Pseudomonadota bacterium]